jgi:hypothetical protein
LEVRARWKSVPVTVWREPPGNIRQHADPKGSGKGTAGSE